MAETQAKEKSKIAKASEAQTINPVTGGSTISVRLIRSQSGQTVTQRATLTGLGFYKSQQTRQVLDTPENRGQINKVKHLLEIIEN